MAGRTRYRLEMLCSIREPRLMGGQYILVALKTGIFQPVPRGRGAHVVRAVAIGAAQTGLAMHAAGIRLEDGAVTLTARGSGRCVVGGFCHHRVRAVAVRAHGCVRVPLTQESGVNTALVQLEYGSVTSFADLRLRERIFTHAVDLRLDRRMVLERSAGMADGAPDLVVNRFR